MHRIDGQAINVAEVVRLVRSQRLQTGAQYMFIYKALLDYAVQLGKIDGDHLKDVNALLDSVTSAM